MRISLLIMAKYEKQRPRNKMQISKARQSREHDMIKYSDTNNRRQKIDTECCTRCNLNTSTH